MTTQPTTTQQQHHLIRMLNQIAANHEHYQDEQAAARAVATHIGRFWARSMKDKITACSDAEKAQLSPISRRCVALLQEE